MLSKYLKEHNLKPSIEYIDLYSFIKYVECFRYKENVSIKQFYNKNKNQLGLYYFSAGAGLSQSTTALLEELGIKNYNNIYKLIVKNTNKIFDKIINNTKSDYFNEYCKLAKNGKLDKII